MLGFAVGLITTAVVLCGCQLGEPAATTIRGEIDNDEIRLEQPVAPPSVWLELTNVGTEPCDLVPMFTELPTDALPVQDGRIVMSLGGGTQSVTPLEAYVEVNGTPVERGDGVMTEQGWISAVGPGDVARIHVAFEAAPEVGQLVLACNEQGDYEAGRYVAVGFQR